MKIKGRCPTCNVPIFFEDLLEIIRCPECKDVFNPEYLKPLNDN